MHGFNPLSLHQPKLGTRRFYKYDYASVTFAAAAVRSKISTANINYTAAAVFPRSHTVAVTYDTAAARRILNLWKQKTCGCRTAFSDDAR